MNKFLRLPQGSLIFIFFIYFKISDSLDNALYSVAWLRLDQISARNFDKSVFLYYNWIRFFISSCFAKARIG